MPFEGQPIHLTDAQRDDLEEIARSHALAAGFVQRAKIVLFLADGVSARAVEARLSVSRPTIAKWRRRFLEDGVEGLTGRHRGRRPWKLTARVRARVLAATRRPPPDGTTHWSCRRLAAHLGVGKDIVQRVWREADLRPARPTSSTSATSGLGWCAHARAPERDYASGQRPWRMASITIRNLDDDVKTRLRVRAADNGRSMEEEARPRIDDLNAGILEVPNIARRLRTHRLLPSDSANSLVEVLRRHAADIETGAVVVVSPDRHRVRLLPLLPPA